MNIKELEKVELKDDGKNDERFRHAVAKVATVSKDELKAQERKEKEAKRAKA